MKNRWLFSFLSKSENAAGCFCHLEQCKGIEILFELQTKVVESKPAYGKKVEHLRSIIKDCGIT